MSSNKNDKSDKQEKAGEIAKNIWLAGLGAYGKAYDAATDRSKEADSFFEGLVERGQELEQQAREQIEPGLKKPKIAIEERIEKMRSYLGVSGSSPSPEVEKLQKKIKSLEAKLKSMTDK